MSRSSWPILLEIAALLFAAGTPQANALGHQHHHHHHHHSHAHLLQRYSDGLTPDGDSAAAAGSSVFFLRGSQFEGVELWRATPSGAQLVHAFPKNQTVEALTAFDSQRVVFVTGDPSTVTYSVWVTDGTAGGTGVLADNATRALLLVTGGSVYYSGVPPDDSNPPREELWRVAPGGAATQMTHLSTTVDHGPDSWTDGPYDTDIDLQGVVAGHILFLADPDTWTGTYDTASSTWQWQEDPGPGIQLFAYDPGGSSTMLTASGCSLSSECSQPHPTDVESADDVGYGSMDDDSPFITGGTVATTHALVDHGVFSQDSSAEVIVGDAIYLSVVSPNGKSLGLWVLTPSGVHRIERLRHGEGEVMVGGLRGRFYFVHSRRFHGGLVDTLWSTNSVGHVKLVDDLGPVATLDFARMHATSSHGRLFFTTQPSQARTGSRVYSTKGRAGTTRVEGRYAPTGFPDTTVFGDFVGLQIIGSTSGAFYTVDGEGKSDLYFVAS